MSNRTFIAERLQQEQKEKLQHSLMKINKKFDFFLKALE